MNAEAQHHEDILHLLFEDNDIQTIRTRISQDLLQADELHLILDVPAQPLLFRPRCDLERKFRNRLFLELIETTELVPELSFFPLDRIYGVQLIQSTPMITQLFEIASDDQKVRIDNVVELYITESENSRTDLVEFVTKLMDEFHGPHPPPDYTPVFARCNAFVPQRP